MWNQLNYGALGVKYGISCHMTQLAYSTGFLLRFQSLSFFYLWSYVIYSIKVQQKLRMTTCVLFVGQRGRLVTSWKLYLG